MTRPPWWALALAAVALVVIPGGAAVVLLTMSEEQKRVRRAARQAEQLAGLTPGIIEAIGYVESRWRMSAVNKSGADGARGGSWGPFQLSEMTARAYGYAGPMEEFTQDPDTAALWCANILMARPGGPPTNTNDAAAWWNGGRTTFAALPVTNTARTDYAPKLASALDLVRGSPVA